MSITIRTALSSDAEQLLEIYTPYVRDTAISFEYDIPTVGEFSARIENTLKKYPYFVAEADGEIVGYTYAGP
ncbi:MAG: GNAT family N-acetyltransferase, partial [Lachnospiraceae bacterium]|nr:GNAT family N-acetyltransferase [Lachnospiraceae bacterium]